VLRYTHARLHRQPSQNHKGQFLDYALREPVRVTRQGRTMAVLLAAQDYEAMRVRFCKIAANRLQSSLAANAAQAGLTEVQALLDGE
jgi:PHD/YefM family antitoxin component YafN of YafNO toxin-antitoxin module